MIHPSGELWEGQVMKEGFSQEMTARLKKKRYKRAQCRSVRNRLGNNIEGPDEENQFGVPKHRTCDSDCLEMEMQKPARAR